MKRSDILVTPDHYLNTIRRVQKLQLTEDANLLENHLIEREQANQNWAVLYDLQNLFILMKRANVTMEELQDWVKYAQTVRQSLFLADEVNTPTPQQKKMFQ